MCPKVQKMFKKLPQPSQRTSQMDPKIMPKSLFRENMNTLIDDPYSTSGMSGPPQMHLCRLFFGVDFALRSRPFKILPQIRIVMDISQNCSKLLPQKTSFYVVLPPFLPLGGLLSPRGSPGRLQVPPRTYFSRFWVAVGSVFLFPPTHPPRVLGKS